MFDSGYPYNLLDTKYNPSEYIKCSWNYSFKASVRRYLVIVELYNNDIYVIKYHAICHKKSKDKYSFIYNDEKATQIIRTCINIMLDFYKQNKNASFGFIGANSNKKSTKKGTIIEPKSNTQRYRIYKTLMFNFFGKKTFAHSLNKKYSAYLMINRNNKKIRIFKREAQIIFSKAYLNLNFS